MRRLLRRVASGGCPRTEHPHRAQDTLPMTGPAGRWPVSRRGTAERRGPGACRRSGACISRGRRRAPRCARLRSRLAKPRLNSSSASPALRPPPRLSGRPSSAACSQRRVTTFFIGDSRRLASALPREVVVEVAVADDRDRGGGDLAGGGEREGEPGAVALRGCGRSRRRRRSSARRRRCAASSARRGRESGALGGGSRLRGRAAARSRPRGCGGPGGGRWGGSSAAAPGRRSGRRCARVAPSSGAGPSAWRRKTLTRPVARSRSWPGRAPGAL